MALTFRQTQDDRISVAEHGAEPTVYRFGNLPKPCVHPLLTPAGRCLSGFQMSDHVWHRGLWFTIKFINGENFWEERPPFGVQKTLAQPKCDLPAPDHLRVNHSLDWTSDASGALLHEDRTIVFHPGPADSRLIDWSTRLTADRDLTLDRTPYTTWGGYGGLAFRGTRELHNVSFLLPSGQTVPSLAGEAHDWTVMQGQLDGGADETVSIGIVDHPQNPRSPSPWYNKSGPGWSFMNAAFLFHEPLKLPAGHSLHFRYRVAYRDGHFNHALFAALAADFRDIGDHP